MRRRWTVIFLAALAACLMVPAAAHAAERDLVGKVLQLLCAEMRIHLCVYHSRRHAVNTHARGSKLL